jgi:hypothetical protein
VSRNDFFWITPGDRSSGFTVTLIPFAFLGSTLLVLKHGLRHVMLGGYSPCILLSCLVARLLNKWFLAYGVCMKRCRKRTLPLFLLLSERMMALKENFDVLVGNVVLDIEPYWKKLLHDHADKNSSEIFKSVVVATDLIHQCML